MLPEAYKTFEAGDFQRVTGATAARMADLERYRELLETWNQRINLVGPSAMASFWLRHAYDSAQLLALAPDSLVWADLGTGAGLPGVVLAILLKDRAGAHVHSFRRWSRLSNSPPRSIDPELNRFRSQESTS